MFIQAWNNLQHSIICILLTSGSCVQCRRRRLQ